MTRTELKIKLAEKILPTKNVQVKNNPYWTPEFKSIYDYELAEKIVNFLYQQGFNLEE